MGTLIEWSASEQTGVEAKRGGVELVEQLAPRWRQLCREAPHDAPFYRPEWIAAYLRAFQPNGELLLLAAHRGERLSAVLPLIEQEAVFCGLPVRKLSGAANVHSGRFDLVRAAGADGSLGVKAIWEFLRERHRWDVIVLPDVPEDGSARELLEAARHDGCSTGQWRTLETPYIPLTGVSDAAKIPADAHFRQNLRRCLRNAQERGDVRLQLVETADPSSLETFFALEKSGWKGHHGSAISCQDATTAFYREIARAAEAFGYFSLYLLQCGDKVIAGHYGLTYQDRYYIPKVAYDEQYARVGPGHLLVDAVLRECLRRGIREFDFLGPRMSWKEAWTGRVRCHDSCYIFRPGVYGRTLYQAKFRMQAALREVVRRPGVATVRERGQRLLHRLTRGASTAHKSESRED